MARKMLVSTLWNEWHEKCYFAPYVMNGTKNAISSLWNEWYEKC